MDPMMLLLWTSADICPAFQTQGEPPYLCALSSACNIHLRFTFECDICQCLAGHHDSPIPYPHTFSSSGWSQAHDTVRRLLSINLCASYCSTWDHTGTSRLQRWQSSSWRHKWQVNSTSNSRSGERKVSIQKLRACCHQVHRTLHLWDGIHRQNWRKELEHWCKFIFKTHLAVV